jgi:hypothetical protein
LQKRITEVSAKELEKHWHNLTNKVLARAEQVIEQAFTKLDTMMSKQPATSTTVIASSPPPPTPTLESSKTLNPTEIVQPDRVSATSENKEIDIKYEK